MPFRQHIRVLGESDSLEITPLTWDYPQRLDIRGKIKPLYGQNRKTEDPPLALFCICTPFGPPSLLEMPQKEAIFKSKHKLDLGVVSFDQRGKEVFGYSDVEFSSRGIYDLVHHDDLVYVAQAHSECKYLLLSISLKVSTPYLWFIGWKCSLIAGWIRPAWCS